ncbi:MAG: glycosyltransferase [Candidatus Omnitrophica bacterium]|nr:glycosyltransferase [Candidatus Omnitrophota bacterium]
MIIPIFNGVPYIRGAVESVLNQTFKDFEIIVVDDGSTDDTKALLEPWIRDKKIRYVYQDNKGLAGARNTGIKLAKGKYLKFLDCDDLLYPEQLERQVAHLKDKPDNVISTTDFDLEFENKNKRQILLRLKDPQLAQFIEGNPCPAHTILARRDLIERAGGFDESLLSHEDTDLWSRIIIRGGRFEKIDYTGCCYRILESGLSADSDKMFLYQCRYSEKLNKKLLPRLRRLGKKTREKLYLKNTLLIHMCYARKLKPASCLRKTLKMAGKLYRMKSDLLSAWNSRIIGIGKTIFDDFQADCMADPDNSEKLRIWNTVWRDERYYNNPNFLELAFQKRLIKNILYFNTTSVVFGAETRLLDIIRNLNRDKYRPFALLPVDGPLVLRLEELKVIVKFLECRFAVNKSNLTRFLRLNRDFVRMARENRIDLIHVNLHLHFSNLWLAFLILRKPLVIHLRSHFYLHIFEKFVMCRAFKVICISKFTQQSFLTRRRSTFFMSHTSDQTEVIHDGIDIKRFYPQDTGGRIRKELNISESDFLVGIIGAVDKVKGQDILVKAADIVVRKHEHAKFLIAGDLYGTYESALKFRADLLQLIKDLGLEDNVIMHGFRGDIEILMNEIDLLVQPSEREALGTSMVEAMACGKPVIGTDIDGIPEVIGDNESGILLNPRTPEELAKDIIFFIENRDEAKKRGMQGQKRVTEMFNVYRNIKNIERIYAEALDSF